MRIDDGKGLNPIFMKQFNNLQWILYQLKAGMSIAERVNI